MRLGARAIGRLVVGAAVAGIVASVLGAITGVLLVQSVDDSVGRSLDVTADTLVTIEESLGVAAETLALVHEGLGDTEQTGAEVVAALGTGAELLRSTADLTETEIAPSLSAVEGAMPDLVSVASGIDAALSALSRLPVGITYDPDQGLDDALRDIQSSLAGTGEQLRSQAALVRRAGEELDEVAAGGEDIVERVGELEGGIGRARALLDGYTANAEEARQVVDDARDEVDTRTAVGTTLVVALALAVALGQVGPLWLGTQLVRHADRVDAALGRVSDLER